jgi:hypothetical protein
LNVFDYDITDGVNILAVGFPDGLPLLNEILDMLVSLRRDLKVLLLIEYHLVDGTSTIGIIEKVFTKFIPIINGIYVRHTTPIGTTVLNGDSIVGFMELKTLKAVRHIEVDETTTIEVVGKLRCDIDYILCRTFLIGDFDKRFNEIDVHGVFKQLAHD